MNANFFDEDVTGLSVRLEALKSDPFIQSGRIAIDEEIELNNQIAQVNDAVRSIQRYVGSQWHPDMSEQVARLHGVAVAARLVHDYSLRPTQVRQVLERLREIDEGLLNRALFQGGTVLALLRMGVSGLEGYWVQGEGFFAGAIRADYESRLSQSVDSRDFDLIDRGIVVPSFIAGMFQGIGNSIINNVKAIYELFTPSFWQSMYHFITDFLPNFINGEKFRFELGQMLGVVNIQEERRLAVAGPWEYGRTMGEYFGMALTEIVLSFVGLGWILKSVNGSARLARIARPFVELARAASRTAIAQYGIKVIDAIAEGVNVVSIRLERLRNRIPAITNTERFRRELALIEQQELQSKLMRIEELQMRADELLAIGSEEEAARGLSEISDATDAIEREIADVTSEVSLSSVDSGFSFQSGNNDPQIGFSEVDNAAGQIAEREVAAVTSESTIMSTEPDVSVRSGSDSPQTELSRLDDTTPPPIQSEVALVTSESSIMSVDPVQSSSPELSSSMPTAVSSSPPSLAVHQSDRLLSQGYNVRSVRFEDFRRSGRVGPRAIENGVIYEFPGGFRTWRDPQGNVISEGLLGPNMGRDNSYNFQRHLNTRPGRENAHAFGQGTGVEGPLDIFSARVAFNQGIENHSIERFERAMYKVSQEIMLGGQPLRLRRTVVTVPESTNRALKAFSELQSRVYRMDIIRPDGSTMRIYEIGCRLDNQGMWDMQFFMDNSTLNTDPFVMRIFNDVAEEFPSDIPVSLRVNRQ